MNQKGFANIILIVLVVVLVGALGYVTLFKKSPLIEQSQSNNLPNTEIPLSNSVSKNLPLTQIVADEVVNGKFVFPTSTDVLRVGQTYVIKWKSPQKYLGQKITEIRLEPLGYPGSIWGLVSQRAGLTNQGEATIVIPSFLSDVKGFTFPGKYTVSVYTMSGKLGVEGFGLVSDQFQITK